MTDAGSQRSLTRVWIWILIVIVAAWIIYAVAGGPSTPPSQTAADSPAAPR